MVAVVHPPRLSLDAEQLSALSKANHPIYLQAEQAQLQMQPTFVAMAESLRALFALYQQAQDQLILTQAEKAALAGAWQDYCRDMLAFVRYLKSTVKSIGANTTYLIGQAYLQQLMAPYATLIGKDFAHIHDDNQLLIQQLLFQPGNIEVLALEKLLSALEKYYRTHQTLVAQLNTYARLAKKLAEMDFCETDPALHRAQQQLFEQDFGLFQQTLIELQKTRRQLSKQIHKLEKRFALFLIGPLFKLFWGQQQKMCKVVMATIDDRIQHISAETAHHLNGQGSRYLSFLNKPGCRDPLAGSKLRCLNQSLKKLSQTHPCPEINGAAHQLSATCQRYIETKSQSADSAMLTQGKYLGACLQDDIALDHDYRQELLNAHHKVEAAASALLTEDALSTQERRADLYLAQHNQLNTSQHYRRVREVLTLIQQWQPYCDVAPVLALDLSIPQADKLSAEFNRILATEQWLYQPVERLLCIRRFGNIGQRTTLSKIIEGFLSNYLHFDVPEKESERCLAVIFKVGNPAQQDRLHRFLAGCDSLSLLGKADDQASLAKAISTLRHAVLYASRNEQDALAEHCRQIVEQLPSVALLQLAQQQGDNTDIESRVQNVIEVCMGPSVTWFTKQTLSSTYACNSLLESNHLQNRHPGWQRIKAMITLFHRFPEAYADKMAPLQKSFMATAIKIKAHLQTLAQQQSIEALNDIAQFHGDRLHALLQYASDDVIPRGSCGVAGYFLFQALIQHWQVYLDENNEQFDLIASALDDCLFYLNELLKQNGRKVPEFIYPQAFDVMSLLTSAQSVLEHQPSVDIHLDTHVDTATERQLTFLQRAALEQNDFPHLAKQANWLQKLNTLQQDLDQSVLEQVATVKLEAFHRWLQQIDFADQDIQPGYHEKDSEDLLYSLWHGLSQSTDPHTQQTALQVVDTLVEVALQYLHAYAETAKLNRWSLAHVNHFSFVLHCLAVAYDSQQKIPDSPLFRSIGGVYLNCQWVGESALLTPLFREIMPEPWQQAWSPVSNHVALYKHRENLNNSAPLTKQEQQTVQRLNQQLHYLAEGKGNSSFADLALWRRVDERVLYSVLDEVVGIADQRKQRSQDYVSELANLKTYCKTPPPGEY